MKKQMFFCLVVLHSITIFAAKNNSTKKKTLETQTHECSNTSQDISLLKSTLDGSNTDPKDDQKDNKNDASSEYTNEIDWVLNRTYTPSTPNFPPKNWTSSWINGDALKKAEQTLKTHGQLTPHEVDNIYRDSQGYFEEITNWQKSQNPEKLTKGSIATLNSAAIDPTLIKNLHTILALAIYTQNTKSQTELTKQIPVDLFCQFTQIVEEKRAQANQVFDSYLQIPGINDSTPSVTRFAQILDQENDLVKCITQADKLSPQSVEANRPKIASQLNEMLQVATKQNNCLHITQICDISEKHNIPLDSEITAQAQKALYNQRQKIVQNFASTTNQAFKQDRNYKDACRKLNHARARYSKEQLMEISDDEKSTEEFTQKLINKSLNKTKE